MSGIFITFEGPDASGKTTQMDRLASYLKAKGADVLTTREPGGTPISEKIRDLLLDRGNAGMSPLTEALLYAAARAQHVCQVIGPALEAGRVVVSDRFLDSSVAYQGFARGLGDVVRKINEPAAGGLRPDVTFLLCAQPEALRARRGSAEEDRIEAQSEDFHREVVRGYMKIAEEEPERVYLIDAERDADEIAAEIRGVVDSIYSGSRW